MSIIKYSLLLPHEKRKKYTDSLISMHELVDLLTWSKDSEIQKKKNQKIFFKLKKTIE